MLNFSCPQSTTLSKKGFFNGSSEWPKVLPGTFCYLNQGKSPNYTQLWRTIKGSSFSCEEPLKVLHLFTPKEPLKVLHLFTGEETCWRTIKGSSRVKSRRTLNGSSLSCQGSIMVLQNKRTNTHKIRLLNFSCKLPSIV